MSTPFARCRRSARGQSVVEFALVLPILVILMIGIIDLARIYTTMLSVESAAREAADFGTFGSQKWGAAVYSVPLDGTEAKMEHRACVAASDLPDYVGPDDSCSNPTFSYQLSSDRGATWVDYDPALACDDPTREPPCWVKVTLQYDFRLLVPLNMEVFGVRYGIPNSLTFERSSIFAMTDLELDP
jgi:hypothetical protein